MKKSNLKDRWFCKKSTGNIVAVHVQQKKGGKPGETHRVLNSGYVVPKTRKTWETQSAAKKHCASFKVVSASKKLRRRS